MAFDPLSLQKDEHNVRELKPLATYDRCLSGLRLVQYVIYALLDWWCDDRCLVWALGLANSDGISRRSPECGQ